MKSYRNICRQRRHVIVRLRPLDRVGRIFDVVLDGLVAGRARPTRAEPTDLPTGNMCDKCAPTLAGSMNKRIASAKASATEDDRRALEASCKQSSEPAGLNLLSFVHAAHAGRVHKLVRCVVATLPMVSLEISAPG